MARTIRLHIVDSAGTPIPDAGVMVQRHFVALVSGMKTDAHGDAIISISAPPDENNLVVRKPGFGRLDRFLPNPPTAGVVGITLMLTPPDSMEAALLANGDTRPSVIEADEIEHLKPDSSTLMMKILRGERLRDCHIENLWVNGQWVSGYRPSQPAVRVAERPSLGAAYNAMSLSAAGLKFIDPEHISAVYIPCERPGAVWSKADDRLVVRLKPGVRFSYSRGSYVDYPRLWGNPELRHPLGRTSSDIALFFGRCRAEGRVGCVRNWCRTSAARAAGVAAVRTALYSCLFHL